MIEFLFAIVKLIDNLIYTNQKLGRDKQRLSKQQRQEPSEKSASYIAMVALEKIPPLIYRILLQAIRGNEENGKIILENEEFLSQQILKYGNEISVLMKEAVRNSTNIQIVDWLRLVEALDESQNNLQNQIIYIDIISLGMVDQHGQGMRQYQKQVYHELKNRFPIYLEISS